MVKSLGSHPRDCRFKSCPDYQRPVAQSAEHTSDTREVECSNHSWSTNILGVAQSGQSSALGTRMSQVRILLPRPINGEHSLMAKHRAVTAVDTGSTPVAHPTLADMVQR